LETAPSSSLSEELSVMSYLRAAEIVTAESAEDAERLPPCPLRFELFGNVFVPTR